MKPQWRHQMNTNMGGVTRGRLQSAPRVCAKCCPLSVWMGRLVYCHTRRSIWLFFAPAYEARWSIEQKHKDLSSFVRITFTCLHGQEWGKSWTTVYIFLSKLQNVMCERKICVLAFLSKDSLSEKANVWFGRQPSILFQFEFKIELLSLRGRDEIVFTYQLLTEHWKWTYRMQDCHSLGPQVSLDVMRWHNNGELWQSDEQSNRATGRARSQTHTSTSDRAQPIQALV